MKRNTLLFLTLILFFQFAKSQELVKNICNGVGYSGPVFLGSLSGGILFRATTPSEGSEPWFSDGTSSGTKILKDINPDYQSSNTGDMNACVKVNTNWFFIARHLNFMLSLWKTDGTEKGTIMVKDLGQNPGIDAMNISMAANNNLLYFTYRSPSDGEGRELWKSDGTTKGTVLIKEINPDKGSDPSVLVSLGNYVYFFANDGTHGNELWRSNGTDTGTKMVKDIYPGTAGTLWTSLMVFKNKIYFGAQGNNDEGVELYVSDGTKNGTELLMDINIKEGGHSYPTFISSSNDFLFFRADNGSMGIEPWITDGTKNGTKLLKDIDSGANHSYPYNAIALGNKIIFDASDITHGREFWVTDGTPGGTQILKDILPGKGNAYNRYLFNATARMGNKLYFVATDSTYGTELWETDGTPAGTKLKKDINPGKSGSELSGIFAHGSVLYLSSRINDKDTIGQELYKFEMGTPGGSIEKVTHAKPLIYPNPVSIGNILSIDKSGRYSVFLSTLDGRTLYSNTFLSNEIRFRLPDNVSKGIYMLKLQNDSEIIFQKIYITGK